MRSCPECGRRYVDGIDRCSEDGAALVPDEGAGMLPPGSKLAANLTVESMLGEGPTGQVYAAEGPMGRVAVKLFTDRLSSDGTFLGRQGRLIERLRQVTDEGVATVFGRGELKGRAFVVRELVEGDSVAATVRSRGALPAHEALGLATAVSDALAEAHRRGALHLNLRPSNVFVTGPNTVKLVDFGIGAPFELGDKPLNGDPHYMAPEQFEEKLISFRSDIYGLGGLLFFMLTGEPPFSGTPVELAAKARKAPPPKPSSVMDAWSELGDLDSIVLRALEKTPAKRFLSVQHFARATDAIGRPSGGGDGDAGRESGGDSSAARGRTLQWGQLEAAQQRPDRSTPRYAKTLQMGAVEHHADTVEMPAEEALPEKAIHPRLLREAGSDDTIRMDDPSFDFEAMGLRTTPLPPDPSLGEGNGNAVHDTTEMELPEGNGVDPMAPLPPPRERRQAATIPMMSPPPGAVEAQAALDAAAAPTPVPASVPMTAGASPNAAAPPMTAPPPPEPARAPRRELDTIPMKPVAAPRTPPAASPEPDIVPDVEVVTEEPVDARRARRRKKKGDAEVAVRGEAAVRFHRRTEIPLDEPNQAVLVDNQLIEEARGPERHHETLEIRERPEVLRAAVAAIEREEEGKGRVRRVGKIVISIAVLVTLFVIAAVAAASVARCAAARRAAATPAAETQAAPEAAAE